MRKVLLCLAVAIGISGCAGQTDPATNITATSATLQGQANCLGIETAPWWFRYRAAGGDWQEGPHHSDCQSQVSESVSGLSPNTTYQFEGCDLPGDVVFCANANGQIVPATTGGPPEPIDSFTTLDAPNLIPVDGGPDYYSQFTHPFATAGDSNYFPIGTWGQYDFTQAHIAQDQAVGYNTYVDNGGCCPSAGEVSTLDASGMRVLNDSNWYSVTANSSSNRGYILDDEVDGRFGVPQGFTVMQQDNAAAPNDGRIRYANYTKNVLIWLSDADAARFVNEFQQITSSDLYWFTDPYQVPTMQAPDWFPEAGQTISTPQIRRAANYGYQIDRMRQLDAMDGSRQPIWAVVEEGWPFTQTAAEGARAITPPEMRAAVWHSLIAGARGIIYFGFSFGGPCPTQYIDRDTSGCYTAIQQELTRTNGQIAQLAPVLNAPSEPGFASVTPGVRLMTKNNGTRYVFAGSTATENSSPATATFTVGSGSTATVLFENRSIPITNGQFTDTFADGNAVHIYRIDP